MNPRVPKKVIRNALELDDLQALRGQPGGQRRVAVDEARSLRAPALNDANQDDDDGDDQEDMNESAHGVRGDESQNP
jgi:hypothetical protein